MRSASPYRARVIRIGRSVLVFIGSVTAAALTQAQPLDTSRGQRLYEAVCVQCHTQSVHSRSPRAARSFDGIRNYVKRWSQVTAAQWTADEIYEVTVFLNERYYKFDCERDDCRHEVTRKLPLGERHTKAVTTAK
jgi:hypothetical protein